MDPPDLARRWLPGRLRQPSWFPIRLHLPQDRRRYWPPGQCNCFHSRRPNRRPHRMQSSSTSLENSTGGPCGPAGPCGPVAPIGPVAPVKPIAPCGPAGPCTPAGPMGPTGPTTDQVMPVSLAVQFKVELTMRTAPVVELTHAVTAVDRVADPTVTVAAPEMVETAVDVAVMVADPSRKA